MLELSAKTTLLEENDYRYSLQDVKDPVLYRDVYNLSLIHIYRSCLSGTKDRIENKMRICLKDISALRAP